MHPADLLLGVLATCGTFVCETAAGELGLAQADAVVEVEGDAQMAEHFRRRCPVFTTLEQAAPIELDVVTD